MNTKDTSKKEGKNSTSFLSLTKYVIISYLIGMILGEFYNEFTKEENPYSNTTLIMNQNELNNVIDDLEKKFNVTIADDKKDEFLMLKAIIDNDNLSDEDKKVFYGLYSVINDFSSLNREQAYKSLSKVEVNRKNDEYKDSTLEGDYTAATEQINIYNVLEDRKVLTHEGIHCIFQNPNINLPFSFVEGMTELITNEYYSEDPFLETYNYPYEVNYIKMLCELVGTDKVKEAFCTGQFSVITSFMDKFNNTNIKSAEILKIYDNAFLANQKREPLLYSYNQQLDAEDALKEIYKNIHPDMSNSKEFVYCLGSSSCIFELYPIEVYNIYLENYGILEKAYFSSNLKENFSNGNFNDYHMRSKVKTLSLSDRFNEK